MSTTRIDRIAADLKAAAVERDTGLASLTGRRRLPQCPAQVNEVLLCAGTFFEPGVTPLCLNVLDIHEIIMTIERQEGNSFVPRRPA